MTAAEFVRKYLEIPYQTFTYRMKNNAFTIDDIHKLCFRLELKFEDLYPNPYSAPRHFQKVVLSSPSAGASAVNKDELIQEIRKELPKGKKVNKHNTVVTGTADAIVHKKKEPPHIQSKQVDEIPFEDVYVGGLQPLP